MKTFKQFQEDISKLPGLGGGGGGTNSITDVAPGRSLKKRIKDVGKLATVPFRAVLGIKSKPDPTEKFATEGVAALAVKGGSKLIPALMTGIGAAGTIMQIKNPKRSVYTGTRKSQKKERIPTKANKKTNEVAKELGLDLTDPRQRRKAQSRAVARGLKKQNKTNKKINPETGDIIKPRYNTKLKGIQIQPKKGEAEATEKLIDKINNPSYLEKVRRNVRKEEIDFVQYIKDRFKERGLSGFIRPKKIKKKKKTIGDLLKNINTNEEMMAAPTNNASSGAIAGLPPDTPPLRRKKRYIYGGTGSRKMWMNNK